MRWQISSSIRRRERAINALFFHIFVFVRVKEQILAGLVTPVFPFCRLNRLVIVPLAASGMLFEPANAILLTGTRTPPSI